MGYKKNYIQYVNLNGQVKTKSVFIEQSVQPQYIDFRFFVTIDDINEDFFITGLWVENEKINGIAFDDCNDLCLQSFINSDNIQIETIPQNSFLLANSEVVLRFNKIPSKQLTVSKLSELFQWQTYCNALIAPPQNKYLTLVRTLPRNWEFLEYLTFSAITQNSFDIIYNVGNDELFTKTYDFDLNHIISLCGYSIQVSNLVDYEQLNGIKLFFKNNIIYHKQNVSCYVDNDYIFKTDNDQVIITQQ